MYANVHPCNTIIVNASLSLVTRVLALQLCPLPVMCHCNSLIVNNSPAPKTEDIGPIRAADNPKVREGLRLNKNEHLVE
jgi:hypothetical protein